MRKFSINQGFTLLELLVSMTILLTVGSMVVSVLVVGIRSTNKVNSMQLIRQNGNDTISQLSKMLQFSRQFDGVSTDDNTYITACEQPKTGTGTLQQYKYVRFTSFDGGQTTISCSTTPPTIASNSASLLDTNTYTVSNCSFTCSQINTSSPQTVGISYTVNKKNATSYLEDPTPVTFSTSVTIRNF